MSVGYSPYKLLATRLYDLADDDIESLIDIVKSTMKDPEGFQPVAAEFLSLYGTSVSQYLKEHYRLHFNFHRLMAAISLKTHVFEAKELHDALSESDHIAISELICPRSQSEIDTIIQNLLSAYHVDLLETIKTKFPTLFTIYQVLLEADTASQTNPPVEVLVNRLIQSPSAINFAHILKNNESLTTAVSVLDSHGKNVRHMIKDCSFPEEVEWALLIRHDWCVHPSCSSAFLLRRAMKGLGTREGSIIRVMGARYLIDTSIVHYYSLKRDKGIARDLHMDLSFHFKDLVMTLLGLE
eukprot:gnl/Dysnectes_brevis/1507_a1705_2158.p1 GENE.gnl/Dysnectes_brevis/1507_a1705_2158~~gnl/Dysnectes_brevis/1507_a1705_2158.p1  ORF type:complete len:297 (+),score=24.02 gnl/Dysnectes_brevis/1507_a1705_2158:80-970(+)